MYGPTASLHRRLDCDGGPAAINARSETPANSRKSGLAGREPWVTCGTKAPRRSNHQLLRHRRNFDASVTILPEVGL